MTNIESMDYTHSPPSTIANSLVPRNFRWCIKPTIYLPKTATISTCYGISIAILRYIAMQLPSFRFIMTHTIIVILLKALLCSYELITLDAGRSRSMCGLIVVEPVYLS